MTVMTAGVSGDCAEYHGEFTLPNVSDLNKSLKKEIPSEQHGRFAKYPYENPPFVFFV